MEDVDVGSGFIEHKNAAVRDFDAGSAETVDAFAFDEIGCGALSFSQASKFALILVKPELNSLARKISLCFARWAIRLNTWKRGRSRSC